MKRFLEAAGRFLVASGRAISAAWKISRKWLSVPANLCLAVLGLVFVVSFAVWAIGYPFGTAVLYFPDAKGVLHGELREVPRGFGGESRAELIASELLLGPKTLSLTPAFAPGARVQSVIYRKGKLFLDISPEAALGDPASTLALPAAIRIGETAMERSLRAALPGISRLTLTIGGKEPYAAGIKAEEGGRSTKKTGK